MVNRVAAASLRAATSRSASSWVEAGETPLHLQALLFDPQTAGGLLIAVHPEDAGDLYRELGEAVPSAQRIGEIAPYRGGKRIFLG